MGAASSTDGATTEHRPSWQGGGQSADAILNSCQGCMAHLQAYERLCLRDCLKALEAGQAGATEAPHRRTIWTRSRNVNIGEAVRVVHVYEALPPRTLFQLKAPKRVVGVFVDGVLADVDGVQGLAREQRARAAAAFDERDLTESGTLNIDQLWSALVGLSLDSLVNPDIGAGSDGSTGGQGRLDEPRRAALRCIAGGEHMGRDAFVSLATNVLGVMADADAMAALPDGRPEGGAVEAASGVDVGWVATQYTFDTPGTHVVSWHGLCPHAGWAASNELTINVMPRLGYATVEAMQQPRPTHKLTLEDLGADGRRSAPTQVPKNLGGLARKGQIRPLRKPHFYGKLAVT